MTHEPSPRSRKGAATIVSGVSCCHRVQVDYFVFTSKLLNSQQTTEIAEESYGTARTGATISRPAKVGQRPSCSGRLVGLFEERRDEGLRVELPQIFDPLADSDEVNRQSMFVHDAQDDAALGGPI